MAFLSSMNISASGMTAQKTRLNIISENITNVNTTRTEEGGPYVRKTVVFQSIGQDSFKDQLKNAISKSTSQANAGVYISEIIEDQTPLESVYDPEHVDADEDGYVLMPNVDMIKETADAMEATRAYQANITAFNAVKTMATSALDIGK